VRARASGLLLFEQYRRRSPGLKELMLLSLLTASHAREAAARRGQADPEAAQLCGMFRNLGEVLAAAHLPSEYAEIMRRTKENRAKVGVRRDGSAPSVSRARAAAVVAVLGCTFEDIGAAIAKHWGMPESVRRGMRAVGAPGEDALELSTAFGHELAAAIYREDEGSAREAVAGVLLTYAKRLNLTRETLAAVADAAVAETRDTFASARVALDDLRLTRQIASALREPAAADGSAPNEGDAGTDAPLAATPAEPQPAIGGEREHLPPSDGPALVALRERLAHDVASAVADVGAYEMQRAVLVALEAALRGGPFDRACFCAIDVRAGELRARFGLGTGVEALLGKVAVPLASTTACAGPALLRGEEVLLAQGTRSSLADGQWLRMCGAASVGLFPVTVDGTTIGAIYVDRLTHSAGFDVATLAYVRRVVASASQALALRRSRTASAAPTSPSRPALAASEKAELVLRVLRGEPIEAVVEGLGVTVAELSRWRDEFLAGATARLSSV
jgi:hypothetical protein